MGTTKSPTKSQKTKTTKKVPAKKPVAAAKKKPEPTPKQQPFYAQWWFWLIIGVMIVGVVFGARPDNNQGGNTEQGSNAPSVSDESAKKLTFGSVFNFDDLEITIGKNYTFTKVKNQFSDQNGKSVVKVPVTIKNLKKDESHSLNMFYVKFYGPSGTQLDSITAYFMDDDNAEWAGDLRPGASYTKNFHFLYEGDGKYEIEFATWLGSATIVELEIKK